MHCCTTRTFLSVLAGLLLMGGSQGVLAQPWTGILSPSRAMDWSSAGVTGGIPTRTTICQTLNPGATAANINSAISGCGSNHVVFLNAGTYNLAGPINITRNDVTLRGAGVSTILNFSSCAGATFYWASGNICIALQHSGFSGSGDGTAPGQGGVPASTIRDWTGTNGQAGVYTQGATVLDLSSAPTGLSVGGTITLWQTDATNASLPNSGYFVSDKCCTGSGDISWKGTSESHDAGQTQRARVIAINGNQVTIAAPGITRPTGTWATARTPKAGWQTGTLTGVGLESFRIIRPSTAAVIGLNNVADSWVQRIAQGGSTGVALGIYVVDSRNITIRQNWLDPMAGGGGGQFTSYGINMTQVSYSLVENNILKQVESPIMLNAGSSGTVLAYNYENFTTGEGGIQLHEEGAAMNLFEGNAVLKFWFDTIHGNTQLNTAFRNHTFNTEAGMDIWTYNRWYNLIGNVLAGDVVYKTLSTDTTRYNRWGHYCFRLGYGSQYEGPENHDPVDVGSSNQAHDPLVGASAMLWGNYCASGASTRFLSAEVPTGDAVFPNAVPADQTLPASFYYAAKPAWWPTAKAWPPIGPDVTGGNVSGLGGHVNTIPAGDCYTSAGGALSNFAPEVCYAESAQEPTPTILRVIR